MSRVAGAILIVALAAGCGGDDAGLPRPAPERASETLPYRCRAPEGRLAAARAWVEAPAAVAPGRPVRLTLKLRNTGRRPLELELFGPSPPLVDFVVDGADGGPVWRRVRPGQAVRLVLLVRRVAPGATVSFTREWDQRDRRGRPVAPGSYAVRGILPLADDRCLRAGPRRLTVRR